MCQRLPRYGVRQIGQRFVRPFRKLPPRRRAYSNPPLSPTFSPPPRCPPVAAPLSNSSTCFATKAALAQRVNERQGHFVLAQIETDGLPVVSFSSR
jgi:hypothetical protein